MSGTFTKSMARNIFYGAYVMTVLTMISYAMPMMRGRAAANSEKSQMLRRCSLEVNAGRG